MHFAGEEACRHLNFVDFQVGRNWARAEIVEWNGIVLVFRFSGILGQPPDVDQT